MLDRLLELGWLARRPDSRAVRVEDVGRTGLRDTFGCELPSTPASP